jgi:hypothetical protein
MRTSIKVLKINRSKTDHENVIWDKMYLVPKKDEGVIPRLFNYSIVFPKTWKLKETLTEAIQYQTWWQSKQSTLKHRHYMFERTDNPVKPFNVSLMNGNDLIVVPILGAYNKGSKTLTARYLNCKKHRDKIVSARRWEKATEFPTDAYVCIKGKKVQPICMACSNSLEGLAGGCTLGESTCYEHLIFGKTSDYIEAEKAGDPVIEGDYSNLDKDLEEVTNV